VVQATVADAGAFGAWATEAFALWSEEWGAVYEDAASKKTLADIAATWWVLNWLVDDGVGTVQVLRCDAHAGSGIRLAP
jgi:methylenetetrahydrofolate reductase (NADPH)